MDSSLDAQFIRRISDIENNLLTLERSTIDDFNRQWISYTEDLKATLENNPHSLSVSTITTAYAMANRVHATIQTFLELEELSEKLMVSFLTEASSPPNPSKEIISPANFIDSTIPPYIKLSRDWLVANIHNPYPTIPVRDAIARKSRVSRRDVDNWFIDARKRIGWNAVRKTHFLNKRSNMVDAATRFYANDEKLSLSQDVEHALVSIMKNAKDLYADKLGETALAAKLAMAVKDLTPDVKAAARAEKLRQQRKKDRDAYPSPEQSPEPIHSPPSLPDTGFQPISTTDRKRRVLSIPVELIQDESSRSSKRLKLDTESPASKGFSVFPTGLPSPTSSIDETLQIFEPSSKSTPPSSTSTPSRKRRLSESNGQSPSTKRPCLLPVRIRPPVDPFLTHNTLFDQTSFDGWFQQIVGCSDIREISPSGVSIELGNLSEFDCKTPTESRPVSPGVLGQIIEPPVIEVAHCPNPLDLPWNEFDFDNIFTPSDPMPHSSSLIHCVGQASIPTPLAQDISNFQNNSHSSDDFDTLFGLSNSVGVDPVVIPLSPVSNETWDLSASVSTKDDVRDLETHNVDFQNGNCLLASFGFSQGADFLQSRNVISLPALPQDKLRQEKEKEFREACEKAQRLALELQKEPLFS